MNLNNTIANAKNTACALVSDNKENAVLMAKVEFGKTILLQIRTRLKAVLPVFLRGYADNKWSALVVANVIAFMQKFYLSSNDKAVLLTDCVMKAAALELGASYDLPTVANAWIDKAFAGIDLSKLGLGATAAEKQG